MSHQNSGNPASRTPVAPGPGQEEETEAKKDSD